VRSLVYISGNVPSARATHVHGLWQRQQLFIHALAPLFDDIHCIFWNGLGPAGILDPKQAEDAAGRAFQRRVHATVLQAASRNPEPGFFDFYVRGAVSGPAEIGHRRVIADAQVSELKRALRTDASVVFVQGLDVMAAVARLPGHLPVVAWDLNDLESVKFLRSLRLSPWSKGKPLRYLQTLGLYGQERRAAQAATLGFVCSETDRRWARQWLGGNFVAAPNAVEVPAAPPAMEQAAPTLLFVGFAGYEPNRDAADWMVGSIWPMVKREVPEARLLIVGDKPERLRCWRTAPAGVHLLGFVPDLAPVYAGSQVVVCPVRSGSGTRVKLLEAAAQARALVSTRIGAEGIEFEDGKDIVMADKAATFAAACVSLLREPARARQMGRSAWELVRQFYSRDAVINEVRGALARVIESRSTGRPANL
jgi:hypothetical protein